MNASGIPICLSTGPSSNCDVVLKRGNDTFTFVGLIFLVQSLTLEAVTSASTVASVVPVFGSAITIDSECVVSPLYGNEMICACGSSRYEACGKL